MFKLIKTFALQIVIIILLVIIIIKLNLPNEMRDRSDQTNLGLLSPRVYAGLVKPHNLALMNFAPLKTVMVEFLAKNRLNISVYVENLKNGANFGINEREKYLPASLTKVLVAILVLRQVEKGKITLDTLIDIKPTDKVDTAGSLFMSSEKRLPLGVLLKALLSESDNTALRVLKHYVDPDDKRMIISYLGYNTASLDQQDVGENSESDLVTSKIIYNVFSGLYLSSILKPENSELILAHLIDTDFDIKNKAILPSDVTVAHKFGARYVEQTRCFHDCGIMYIHSKDMRLFYCIMTRDLDEQIAMDLIGKLVNTIYSYSIGMRMKLDDYNYEWHASDSGQSP